MHRLDTPTGERIVRALPMTYQGIQFRSRLEADWAYNLDLVTIPWEYEPEGFQLDDGTRYSPDFWLPTARAWLEVKGDHNRRIDKVQRFAAELWAESGAEFIWDQKAPMVLIGRSQSSAFPTLEIVQTIADQPTSPAPAVPLHCGTCERWTITPVAGRCCRCCGTVLDWSTAENLGRYNWRQLTRPGGGR